MTLPNPVLTLVEELGILQNRDLTARGIHPQQLRRLVDAGKLVRVSRGIETHLVAGIPVRVYNIPKTIADCFKYRSTIGLDVALEALKEAWVARKLDLNLLAHYAQICRVQKVIQPYLEMLVL